MIRGGKDSRSTVILKYIAISIIFTLSITIISAGFFESNNPGSGTENSSVQLTFNINGTEYGPHNLSGNFRQGNQAQVKIKVTDAAGHPIRGLKPQLDYLGSGEHDNERTHPHFNNTHLTSNIDLAVLQLYVLNSEKGSIEIIDPDPKLDNVINAAGSASSKIIFLDSSASDMAISPNGKAYVALPNQEEIVVINTLTNNVEKHIKTANAGYFFNQPNSSAFWLSNDGSDSVIALDYETDKIRRIKVGAGHHQIAFSENYAFATNSFENFVSVIPLHKKAKTRQITVQNAPFGIAFSNFSRMVYVTHAFSGIIEIINPETLKIEKYLYLDKGINRIMFSADGKKGVVLDKFSDTAFLIDAATNNITRIQTGKSPSAVAFLEDYVIILNSDSADITFFNTRSPQVSGTEPLSKNTIAFSPRSIAVYHGEAIITNPEGSILVLHVMGGKPMIMSSSSVTAGSDSATIIENKIIEKKPGEYSQFINPTIAGPIAIEFSSQSINATFLANVSSRYPNKPIARLLFKDKIYEPNKPLLLQYEIISENDKKPLAGLNDTILTITKPTKGSIAWSKRILLSQAKEGDYEAMVTLPNTGAFVATLSSPTLQRRGYELSSEFIISKEESI